jgi:hypothetical protein
MCRGIFIFLVLAFGCASPAEDWTGNRAANVCISGFDDEQAATVAAAVDEWRESDSSVALHVSADEPCELSISATTFTGMKAGDQIFDEIRLDHRLYIDAFHVAVLHELGHFLTGPAHSSAEDDVMFPDYLGQTGLTAADVARLHR